MVKVYYCDIKDVLVYSSFITTLPKQRRDYVLSINDYNKRKQSVIVWKLLEYVLKTEFNLTENEFSCINGKWELKNNSVLFSLTHSNNIVAVAVGTQSIGVDVEIIQEKILKLSNKFGTTDIEQLTLAWTKKESAFKNANNSTFYYETIHDLDNNKYFLTACSDLEPDFIHINYKKFLGV